MRTTVKDASGTGQGKALEQVEAAWALGGGTVDILHHLPAKLRRIL
ncbi:hypothetical protein [Nonomuraea guangzhouensis]|uniref:Uncharacterized protein n=1 Tax=Nonomuraea guangzhouensis TaxID=1291555 RepID=A0ABW4GCZ6_9ACTN|nr:hypothetical protein [Nonomuraea guangzhouensis]